MTTAANDGADSVGYKAHRDQYGRVTVYEGNTPIYNEHPEMTLSLFEWGYQGSGPLCLAWTILRRVTGSVRVASEWADQFCRDVIAQIHANAWILTTDAVTGWLDKVRGEPRVNARLVQHKGPGGRPAFALVGDKRILGYTCRMGVLWAIGHTPYEYGTPAYDNREQAANAILNCLTVKRVTP